MKILAITEHNPFVVSNASNNRFLSLIQGLQQNNCNVSMLIVGGYFNKWEKIKFKQRGKYNNFEYLYLYPKLQQNKYQRKLFNLLFPHWLIVRKIADQIKIQNCDVVWLRHSRRIIKLSIKLFNIALPVKYFHEQSEFSWIGLHNSKVHELYLNRFLIEIDLMSIMTQTLIEYYTPFLKSTCKIIHLPMTVDFSRFDGRKTTTTLKQPYIGYCGTMNNKKDGVDILVDSFINIMKVYPMYNLYLAGPLEPAQDYFKLLNVVKTHKAENRIIFLGLIDKEEMPTFLNNASVLALARPNSKQAEGGFPTKLGEYLATGNPVCVTNVGEIENYLSHGHSAFIATPDSVSSFTNILNEAIVSPISYEIGQNGKTVALKEFNKDIQSKKLLDFLIKHEG